MKTTYPDSMPSFTEWCKMFNVSSRSENPEPKQKAKEIMDTWEDYNMNKIKYVQSILNKKSLTK